MRSPRIARLLGLTLAIAGVFAAPAARAEPVWMDSAPASGLWLNPGFYSYHLQRDRGFKDGNPGLGLEYRLSTVTSLTAGRFHNSDRAWSNYVGAYYQPLAWGPWRLGLVVGAFDGYPQMRDGGWFLAAIPVLGIEGERVGLNIGLIPNYRERLHGAISFQLKFRLSD